MQLRQNVVLFGHHRLRWSFAPDPRRVKELENKGNQSPLTHRNPASLYVIDGVL